ncbi:MAG TPA: iron ABC transporter permease [Candidatus Acidoferrales bacterium]|nr:iron ABC transporter permease [Candidatus Acidoferrales bacterium]
MAQRTLALPYRRRAALALKGQLFFVFVIAILLWTVLIPLAQLILSSFRDAYPGESGPWTLAKYAAVYATPLTYKMLFNTFVLAAGDTLITLSLALVFAWLVERTDLPYKNLAWTLILIPMAMPGVLFSMAWVLLLSPNTGIINVWLRSLLEIVGVQLERGPINVFSLGGMIFLEGIRGLTSLFLILVSAFRMMDPALEEAARVAGMSGWKTVRHVTLPVLTPAILLAGIYSFMSSLDSFEIPAVIGLPARIFVLSTLIFFTARQAAPIDYGLSAAYASLFLIITVALVYIYHRIVRRTESYTTVTGKGYRPRQIALGKWRYAALGTFCLYFLLTVGAPLLVLIWSSLLPRYVPPSFEALSRVSLQNYYALLDDEAALRALFNTAKLMLMTATLTMALALFISWIIVRSRAAGRWLLDAIAFIPHAIPGIVIGLALIFLYLQPPFSYIPIYGTLWIVALGLMTQYLAYATRVTNAAIIQIHKELEDAARICGLSRARAILWVTAPLVMPALVGGWIWVAIHSIRAFSTPLILAGRYNEVIAVRLWEYWDHGELTTATALGVLFVVVLAAITFAGRKLMLRFLPSA